MFDIYYAYLLMGIIYFIIWLMIFYIRKDLRREMIVVSCAFAIVGPISDVIYYQDWWRPITLSGMILSIEPILVGFSLGGIGATIYEVITSKKLKNDKGIIFDFKQGREILTLGIVGLIIAFFTHFALKINSLYVTIISSVIINIYIIYRRRDLLLNSILSGILFLFIAALSYSILNYLTPGWIEEFYYFRNTPKIIFLSLPIDDVLWYFFTGMLIGPLYEFYKGTKLVKVKHKK